MGPFFCGNRFLEHLGWRQCGNMRKLQIIASLAVCYIYGSEGQSTVAFRIEQWQQGENGLGTGQTARQGYDQLSSLFKDPSNQLRQRGFGCGKHQVGDESAACIANRQSVESTIRHAKLRGTEWTKCLDKGLCRHRCKLCWVNLMVT